MIKWNMKKMYDYCKDNNLDLPKEGQEYTNLHNKYIYICPKHGEYHQSWSDHKNGHGCKGCQYSSINKKDDKYFIDKLNNKFKGYIRINKIYRKDRKVYGNFTCNKHNYTYDRLVNRMLDKRKGNLCPLCSKENKIKNRTGKTALKDLNTHIKECKNKRCDLPIYGQEYVNNSTPIIYRCAKGHLYSQTPNTHITNHGCPVCNESHGERFIRNYLDKNNIKYIPQKKFKDLKDKSYLSYDFYLPEYNVLIEYQGIQHYKSVSFDSKNKTDLKKQNKHDKLKRKYAKSNGYKLLELKYTLDTQELVDEYLSRRIR